MNDPEYFKWCMGQLTPHQYCVHQSCIFLLEGGPIEITMGEIGELAQLSIHTVRHSMNKLSTRAFVQYNIAGGKTTLLWARKTITDKPLTNDQILNILAIKLISPTGAKYRVKPGEITDFCRQHSLRAEGVYALTRGEQSTHRNWRLA